MVTPLTLAEDMLDDLDAARTQYVPRLDLDVPHVAWDVSSQPALLFGDGRRLDPTSEASSSHAHNCASSCNADAR